MATEQNKLIAEFSTHATVDEHGVVRWISNGSVPPKDILKVWEAAGLPFNLENSLSEQERQFREFIAEYKAARGRRTPEQIREEQLEARAAMGPGVDMVNIITGERYRT